MGIRSVARQVACLAAALGAFGLVASPGVVGALGSELARYEFSQPQMGTTARIVLYATTREAAEQAASAAFARIAMLDATLSDYRPDSELMRFVERAGQGPVAVSHELLTVLDAAQELAVRTGGAFDITAGSLTRLWRRARRLNELPSPEALAAARERAGHRHLVIDRATRSASLTKASVVLDPGGIAKGYAVDEALAVLRERGSPRSLVAIGGDVGVGDAPPGRDGWAVDIAGPGGPSAPAFETILVTRTAVSTSGDAEQWMTAGGERYSHVIDPRTGSPVRGRSTTTVIAPRGIDADGLDTALSVLGPDEGRPVVDAVAGASALWLRLNQDGSMSEHRSSRWSPLVAPGFSPANPVGRHGLKPMPYALRHALINRSSD